MSFLNKNIISFEEKFFGLDLSDFSAKAFQLEKNGKLDVIRSFGSAEIKKGYIEDGKIIEKEAVAEIIRDLIKKVGPRKINTRKVICSLPESKVFLRIINIPKIEKSEAQEAVKWEMGANIPLPIDTVYFDWQFIEGGPKNMQRVLTVAIHQEIVDSLIEVLEKAGLEPCIFEVESVASARSLVLEQEEDRLNLIIDLGASKTSLIIVENGVPCFTSSIPFSCESLNEAICSNFNLSNVKDGEKMKMERGIENSDGDNPIFESVKPVLENFIGELEKTADFYVNSLQKQKNIDKIILCGGGANLKGLIPYLVKRLKKDVEIGDPWINLELGNNLPSLKREEAIKYSTAIGLALRGFYYED